MRGLRRLFLPFAVMVLLAGGCGDGGSGDGDGDAVGVGGAPDGGLAGRTFLSESVTRDGVPHPLVAGTRIRLAFGDAGTFTASAGCNTMSGSVDVEDARIVVGGLAMTEMGCDPERHEQDAWLAAFLGAGPAYELEGDRLRLSGRGGDRGGTVIELLDREVADPDRALVGTEWRLDGIVEGDAVSSVPGQLTATLVFEAARLVVEVEGCDGGSAAVEIGEATIRVAAWNPADLGCGRGVSKSVASKITRALDGEVAWEVEASSLTVSHPDGHGLMLRAAE